MGPIVWQALLMAAAGLIFGAYLLTCVKDYFPRRVMMLPEDGMIPGEVVGMAGPGSFGKTTLFNIIGCIFEPDGGRMALWRLTARRSMMDNG